MMSEWKIERKTSGWVAAIGVGISLIMITFFVDVGEDWYDNGHLRLCLPSDSYGFVSQTRAMPPAGDEDTPPYWCARKAILMLKAERAEQEQPEQGSCGRDQERTEEKAKEFRNGQASFECTQDPQPPLTADQKQMVEAVNKKMISWTADHFEQVRGYGFWGNTFIDRIFQNGFELLYRVISEDTGAWFRDDLAPAWNAYFATDDRQGKARREAIKWAVMTIGVAFVGAVVVTGFAWLNEIAVSKSAGKGISNRRGSDPRWE